jgi:sporulation protein YlmC with PRC-barrel domain
VRLSELLETKVVTAGGDELGHVHDVRARREDDGRIVLTGLVVGKLGVLERLGIGAPGRAERVRGGTVVPWRDVLESGPHVVIVRDAPSS